MREPHGYPLFKSRLDEALGNLIIWVAFLSMAGGLEVDDLYSLFQPELSIII